MNSFESYELWVTPLSPIHIGTGEEFVPTNYIIDKGFLHHFDPVKTLGALSPKDRESLERILSVLPGEQMLRNLQKFFSQTAREMILATSERQIPVSSVMEEIYEKRLGQVANHESGPRGKNVINKLEIKRTAYDSVTSRPVLFGSSIRGAIRTALLNSRINTVGLQSLGPLAQGPAVKVEKVLFSYDRFEKDPMRLVQMSDVHCVTPSVTYPSTMVRFGVNRKRSPGVSQRAPSNLYQTIECLTTGPLRSFAGRLNIQSVDKVSAHVNKIPSVRFKVDDVVKSCNDFFRKIFDEEFDGLERAGYVDPAWARGIKTLVNEIPGRPMAFLIRVGHHSGAEALTLEGMRSIQIKTRSRELVYKDHPTTYWLAAESTDQTANLIPFGWALVELTGMCEAPARWPSLEALCAPAGARLEKQVEDLSTYLASYKGKWEEGMLRKKQALADEAQRVKAETERLASLMAMSPNMRRVEQFSMECLQKIELLCGRKDKPYTEFYAQAQVLVKEAIRDGWTREERESLSKVIAEYLPKILEMDAKTLRQKLALSALLDIP